MLDEWPAEKVARLAEPVRDDPWYQPLSESETEREFYNARMRKRQELEVEPISWFSATRAGPHIPVEWVAIDPDD